MTGRDDRLDQVLALSLAAVDDMTDAEVDAELSERGLDPHLDAFFDAQVAAVRRRRLDDARATRLGTEVRDFVSRVRQMSLPLDDLISRITKLEGAPAFRELEKVDRAVLEQTYADLLALAEDEEP